MLSENHFSWTILNIVQLVWSNKRSFVYLSVVVIEVPFLLARIWDWLFFLSWNCDIRTGKASIVMYFNNTNSEVTCIQHLFEEYLRPPGRFGIIKPLILNEWPACLEESRCVFLPKRFKSAINLAIEQQLSQAVDSRNASSSKTKHLLWAYGSFAKLQCVSVLEIRTAF